MKKSLLPLLFFGSFALAQSNLVSSKTLADATIESNGKKKTLIEKIKEKELELQVPRETVPVEAINYPIKTKIPKTAYYLPMLQTLLHIEAGTLPNPIGVSIIGSYTQENYRVTKFNGQMGANLGAKISTGVNGYLSQIQSGDKKLPSLGNSLIDAALGAAIKSDALLFGSTTPDLNLGPITIPGTFTPGLLGAGTKKASIEENRRAFFSNLQTKLDQSFGNGIKEWTLSDGSISTKTSAVGVKADIWLFPFMQLFVSGTYLHMEQETNVGNATIPLDQPLVITDILTGTLPGMLPQNVQDKLSQPMNSITFPVGTIRNVLDGWAVMGGTNLAIGYKGFFLSCMIGGGYVKLDDWVNDVSGFVKKPFMYIAPRVGYSLGGVFTAHFGVQRIELFGSTSGNDLSASTGGLVQGYSVEIEKFPVNFLVGTSFTPMRDLGISFEYITSPDSKGLNAEIAYRF